MTAVADTYHSLTSDRPYRKGMAQGKALQIIEDASGTQLCPNCVGLFFKWISQKGTWNVEDAPDKIE
jgi:HD-GYP domain-containing protein (c-di-GMP phosphodiesterase class II)